jgi:hypothetical protein
VRHTEADARCRLLRRSFSVATGEHFGADGRGFDRHVVCPAVVAQLVHETSATTSGWLLNAEPEATQAAD